MPRCISLTLLAVACAIAEEAPVIIVTAERGESELQAAPVAVELVGSDVIERRGGAFQATDWLRDLPGVGVFGTGGGVDGGLVSVRLRGLDQKYTLTLIDGIPQSDSSSIDGTPRQPLLQVPGLDRVEVLKGAQSGLYGSGAVGGVVNYRTVRPTKEHQVRLTASGGSFGTLGGEVVATGPLGAKAGYAVAVNGLASDGFSTTTTDPTGDPGDFEDDSVVRSAGRGRFEHRLGGGTLYVSGSVGRATQEFDGGFPVADPDETYSENRFEQWDVATGGAFGDRNGGFAIDAALQRTSNASYYVAGDPTIYRSEMLWASARGQTALPGGFRLAGGADLRRDSAQIDPGFTPGVNSQGVYATAGWGDERATVEATGRVDHHGEFGTHPTGRLVAGWFAIPEDLKVRGALASGFRAPSLYQLYGEFVPFFVANPGLDPETALSAEVGADWYPADGMEITLTVFRSEVEDRIDYLDPDGFGPLPGGYLNTAGSTTSQGLEAGLRVERQLTDGLLGWAEGSYTHLDTSAPDERDVPFSPQHAGSARLGVEEGITGNWRLRQSLGMRSTTAYWEYPGEVGRVDGATVCDAVLGASWGERLDIALRVDNLFDEDYTVNAPAPVTYATAPRSYTLTVVSRF